MALDVRRLIKSFLAAVLMAASFSVASNGLEYGMGLVVESSIGSLPRGAGVLDTADRFGVNWWGLRADPHSVAAWWEMPDLVSGEIDASWRSERSGWIGLHSVVGLRRDFEAWWSDGAASNLPLSTGEVDINIPYRGYIDGGVGPFEFRWGRFATSTGPSPERGVSLSGAPYLDGLRWSLDFGNGCSDRSWGCSRFSSLYASLDPWLQGTPVWVEDEAGVRQLLYPKGSEGWQQYNSSPVSNQRGRSYREPVKILALHRIDFVGERWKIGLQENAVIGGRTPDWADLSPLMIWHNQYNDGYTNSFTTVDGAVELPIVGTIYGEYSVDDINEDGATQPTVGAALVGWSRGWEAGGDRFEARVEGVMVDPLYGRFALPLLELTARRHWRSNYRDRLSSTFADTGFVDTWVVDAPLGYWRGADVADIWFDFLWHRSDWSARSRVGWLSTGSWNLRPPYDWKNAPSSAASGDPRRELWLQLDLRRELLRPRLQLQLGCAWLQTVQRGDLALPLNNGLQLSAALSWRGYWGAPQLDRSQSERSSRPF